MWLAAGGGQFCELCRSKIQSFKDSVDKLALFQADVNSEIFCS